MVADQIVVLDRGADGREQRHLLPGLGDETVDLGLVHRGRDRVPVGMAGDQHPLDRRPAVTHLLEENHPVDARHAVIRDHHLGLEAALPRAFR